MAERVISSRAPKGSSMSRREGSEDQRPGDGHPLLHAARELVGVVVGEGAEAHQFQQLLRLEAGPMAIGVVHLQGEPDVAQDGAPGQERWVLEDEADVLVRLRVARGCDHRCGRARRWAPAGRPRFAGGWTCRSRWVR